MCVERNEYDTHVKPCSGHLGNDYNLFIQMIM